MRACRRKIKSSRSREAKPVSDSFDEKGVDDQGGEEHGEVFENTNALEGAFAAPGSEGDGKRWMVSAEKNPLRNNRGTQLPPTLPTLGSPNQNGLKLVPRISFPLNSVFKFPVRFIF